MTERISKTSPPTQNEIMKAVKSVSIMIPMIEDFAKRIKVLEEEVASLTAIQTSKVSDYSKSKKLKESENN